MYYFLSGFIFKLVGIECGVIEFELLFLICFGVLFFLLYFIVYVDLLGEFIDLYDVDVYFVNIGWIGGKYGVGCRISLYYIC